ncbi:asparaginase [Rothia nasimurium]|uniref:asparaginase n=2 Tax=Rothia nasimurium TaxID=85336 RepID=UPI001F42AEF8|nr:asparaginase [Rothia nasimurium]
MNRSGGSENSTRLETYPERFRARVAGRVAKVTLAQVGANPRFEVTLLVERSKPLPPAKTHPMTGMPIAETGEDLDDTTDVSTTEETRTGEISVLDAETGFTTRFSVNQVAPRVLYPDFPPLTPGTRLKLYWLGQRQVPGIEAGGYLRVSGMLSTRENTPVIYNPRYEIVQAL